MTIAEVLRGGGYRTYMSGKWHVSSNLKEPTDSWPMQRGFDAFYGTIIGAGSFYDPNTLTRGNENIEHEAHGKDFFCLLYTSPSPRDISGSRMPSSA